MGQVGSGAPGHGAPRGQRARPPFQSCVFSRDMVSQELGLQKQPRTCGLGRATEKLLPKPAGPSQLPRAQLPSNTSREARCQAPQGGRGGQRPVQRGDTTRGRNKQTAMGPATEPPPHPLQNGVWAQRVTARKPWVLGFRT